jgi:hypothetical protein
MAIGAQIGVMAGLRICVDNGETCQNARAVRGDASLPHTSVGRNSNRMRAPIEPRTPCAGGFLPGVPLGLGCLGIAGPNQV